MDNEILNEQQRFDQEHLYVHKYGNAEDISYNELNDKPKINGITIQGDKTGTELGLASTADIPTKLSDLTNDEGFVTSADVPTKLSELTNDEGFVTSADIPTKLSDLDNDEGFVKGADFTPLYTITAFYSQINFTCPIANIIATIQTELATVLNSLANNEYITLEQVIITNLVTLIPERKTLLKRGDTVPVYRLQGVSFGANEIVFVDVNNARVVHMGIINDRPSADYNDDYSTDITNYVCALVYNKYQKGI